MMMGVSGTVSKEGKGFETLLFGFFFPPMRSLENRMSYIPPVSSFFILWVSVGGTLLFSVFSVHMRQSTLFFLEALEELEKKRCKRERKKEREKERKEDFPPPLT